LPFQNYLSPFLREELGMSVEFAATVWGAIGLIGMFSGFAVGGLSDRIGIKLSLLGCYTCIALASFILVAVPVGILPIAAGILFAIAFYPVFGLVPAYVSKISEGKTATRVFAVANVTQGLGGMVGNYAAGTIKTTFGTFQPIYLSIILVSVVLCVMSLLLPKEGRSL
jgi:predicted MFS family arabinose efflux permease